MGDLPYAPIVPNGVGGNYGTKAVPTYVMAEAETAPLPKITVEDPPPPAGRRGLFSRLGDLPMRVIYRGVAGALAVLAVAAAAVVFFVTGRGTPAAGPGGVESLATLGAAPKVTPGAMSPAPEGALVPSASPAPSGSPGSPRGAVVSASSLPSGVPSSGASSSLPSGAVSAPASEVSAQGTATPRATPTPGRSALMAALADPRVPKLPSTHKLADFRGSGAPTKGRVKDRRSGIAFARFVKDWKLTKSSPFATRRTLPGAKGAVQRGMLATCPVPIAVQKELKDTALVAARWTLNYHPPGSKISWTASQPIKAGKRNGWLLGYRVHYELDGKKRTSTAAVALVDISSAKPALVFITIPDAEKKRWADINILMSSVRAL